MNSLIKKFIEFAIGNGIVLVLGLLSTPIVSRLIEPYEKGRADMFTTYTSLAVLVITLGIDQAYIRYFNEEKSENRGKLLRRAVKIPILFNVIVSVILLVFYKSFSNYIVDETSLVIVILFVFHVFSSIISNFALIDVRMKQKAKSYSTFGVINKVCFMIYILLIYRVFKGNYITLVLATVFANISMVLCVLFLERKDWFSINRNKDINTSYKDLLKYGYPFIFSMSITWIFQSVDRIAIRQFSDYTQVGLYGGAMSIIAILNTVQGAFTTFWIPVAYDRYKNDPNDTKFFAKINEIVSFFMLLLAVGLIATKDISIILLDSKYESARYIFPFLVFMPIMYTISETTVLGINFKKKTKYHIIIAGASALTNIIGNFILVPKLGAKGAAISTGIAYMVFFIVRTYLGNKFFKVNAKYLKFFISIALTYVLAIISSIYKFNMLILAVTIFDLVVICILYRNIIMDCINLIKGKFKRKE